MSIAKRPNGRWRARYTDDEGRERARHFDTKGEATRFLKEVTAAQLTGLFVDPRAGDQSLRSYFQDMKEKALWKDSTVQAMTLAVRSTPFVDLPLSKVRTAHLERWVKEMDSRLAPGTVRTRFHNVRTILRKAMKERLIARDPSEDVDLPTVRRDVRGEVPTSEEVRELLANAHSDYRLFFAVAAYAGLRLGEIAGLQRGDLDLPEGFIRVMRQVQRATGGSVVLRLPKCDRTRRVPIPPELVSMLAAHLDERVGDAPDAFLFTSSTGQPPHQNTVGHQMRTTCHRAGLRRLRLHGLRHYFASGLIRAGCDVVTVQEALGHSSAKITLDVYTKLWPDASHRTRLAISELMRGDLDQVDLAPDVPRAVEEEPAA